VIFNPHDQAKEPQIWPQARREAVLASPVAKTLERSPNAAIRRREWTHAIKNGQPFPFMSQFDYSCRSRSSPSSAGSPCTTPDGAIEWDQKKLEVVGLPEAAKFIKRAAYRKGWEYSSDKV